MSVDNKDRTIIEDRNVLRLNNAESNKLTRECLTTALMQLMKEKPIDKITITELVKRSGVSRTAFYRNYSSKEDILEYAREEITNLTNEFLAKPELKEDSYLWFKECFKIVQEHAEVIRTILDAKSPFRTFLGEPVSDRHTLPGRRPYEQIPESSDGGRLPESAVLMGRRGND